MKKIIAAVLLIVGILAAGTFAVLLFTGKVTVGPIGSYEASEAHEPCAYVDYMSSYILLDDEGLVISTSSDEPDEKVPKISGLKFSNVIIGQALETEEHDEMSYILKIIRELKNNDIRDVKEIYVSADGEATLYSNQIKILLGKDERVAEKIADLRDFYSEVADLSGTLDMQQVSDMNGGYTFKKNGN